MRIVIIGGGSRQWGPKLVTDLLTTPSLIDSTIVLHDIDAASLEPMARYADAAVEVLGASATVETTVDRSEALRDADFVVVTVSTGGFDSMAHDLDVPARYGIRQSVGDSVGPGGISRSLAQHPGAPGHRGKMEQHCPDAWLLNITNPYDVPHTSGGTRDQHQGGRAVPRGGDHDLVPRDLCGVPAEEIRLAGHRRQPSAVDHGDERSATTTALRVLQRACAIDPEAAFFTKEATRFKLGLFDRLRCAPRCRRPPRRGVLPVGPDRTGGLGQGVGHPSHLDRRPFVLAEAVLPRQDAPGRGTVRSRGRTRPSGEMVAPVIDSLLTGEASGVAGEHPESGSGAVSARRRRGGNDVRGRRCRVCAARCDRAARCVRRVDAPARRRAGVDRRGRHHR